MTPQQYHQQTKHRLDGYAKGPETLDWDAQPNPFRRYESAPVLKLPLIADALTTPYTSVFKRAAVFEQPFDAWHLSILLQISLGLSAWKQYGNARWALRCNPSSGNLHPTEAYLLVSGIADIPAGLYHYRPDMHGLEVRCQYPAAAEPLPGILIGLSSIPWREAWKYGERAFRYCQHDIGHAIAAIDFAVSAMGWDTHLVTVGDNALITHLLGLNRTEEFFCGEDETEVAELFLHITPRDQQHDIEPYLTELSRMTEQGVWYGTANRLDPKHLYTWPLIQQIKAATEPPWHRLTATPAYILEHQQAEVLLPDSPITLSALARRRRSAQTFDAKTSLPLKVFFQCLDHLLPRKGCAPWDSIPWAPRLHLVVFVHRVEGLAPGLYALPRSAQGEALMRAQLRSEFVWQSVSETPSHLPLYSLLHARAEKTIMKLSCMQAIASDGAFSLGMLAEFDAVIADTPWRYPELFWEAGVIGQCLYLDAEAAGFRGTGIGCYFDDGVHELLGLQDSTLQSLYHFTVGNPLVDARITTLPPYAEHR